MKEDQNKLKIIPLGGLREFGKNLTVLEYKNEILIVDMGFAFPSEDHPGIDVIIPDFSYLRKKKQMIKGVIFTHAHEDHIGSVPYFLKEFKTTLYGTKLTLGLINRKLKEFNLKPKVKTIKGGEKLSIGKNFKIEVIRTTHSIPDSVALAIKTPVGTVFHTGDFKIDDTPIDEVPIDFTKIASIANKGIKVLMSDSTNATIPGSTKSEKTLRKVMEDIFLDNKNKRIIVATFSSNLHRIQTIIDASKEHGRKVALSGRSIESVVETARELGYLDISKSILVDLKNVNSIPDKKLVVIMTGSQGEPTAALTRVANNTHKFIKVKKNDLVVISSSPIPGNEKAISTNLDKLLEMGADVLYSDIADIHVSGHARVEELKTMLKLTKPEYFFPIHGEYRMLMAHAKIAEKVGINRKNIFILKNGNILEVTKDKVKQSGETLPYDPVFVDGHGVGDIVAGILNERMVLGNAGVIVVSAYVDSKRCEILEPVKIFSRGFINVVDNEDIYEKIRKLSEKTLESLLEKGIKKESEIFKQVKSSVNSYLKKELKRFPMVLLNLIDKADKIN